MTLEPTTFLLLLGLGAWSALDGTSVGQVLMSRPLASGTLAGLVVGEPVLGLLVGGILEAVHLVDFPVGAVRLPEPGPGAVPGVATAWLLGGAGGLAAGVGLGVFLAWLAGYTMIRQRHLNERLIRDLLERPATPGRVAARHWLCVLTDGVRGAALTAVGLALALAAPPALADSWPLDLEATAFLLLLPAALAVGALIRRWGRKVPGRLALAAGLGGGLLLAFLVGG